MKNKISPWCWIPTLYYAQGLPYVAVMSIAVIMYKQLGLSNTDIALYTSWLYLPWIIKPLWSPIVDILKTKRWWIITMQTIIGVAFGAIAYTLPFDSWMQYSLAFLWILAFCSATNDIASDGFYMIGLDEHQQAWFSGIRNTFYRLAMLSGQGLLMLLVGWIENRNPGSLKVGWIYLFGSMAIFFIIIAVYHNFALPKESDNQNIYKKQIKHIVFDFFETFISFFKKKNILRTIFFLLTFRFAEAQLIKLSSPFLLDNPENGGMGLSVGDIGFVYGTIGIIALTLGGILGGLVIASKGLKFWIWPMGLAITIPNIAYVILAYNVNASYLLINIAVAIEQFGYGFGFTGYMMYMIYTAIGKHKTAHYAICTAFMALGMMLPGLFSGMIQDYLGYKNFFIWIMLSSIPVYLGILFLKIDPCFGMKNENK